MLGAVDRLAGLVIGALKWLLLMSILLNLAQLADIGLPVYGSRIVTGIDSAKPVSHIQAEQSGHQKGTQKSGH